MPAQPVCKEPPATAKKVPKNHGILLQEVVYTLTL